MLSKIKRDCSMEVEDISIFPVNGCSFKIEFTTYAEEFIHFISEDDMKHYLESQGYTVEKLEDKNETS